MNDGKGKGILIQGMLLPKANGIDKRHSNKPMKRLNLKPSPEGEGVDHVDEVDLQPLAVVVGDG